ncbi:unannotated protein [freshwater metagenome]|uniref:Unannotated protein n=1 Tax=freshwater metagenome TaxID=449393 RepID=A0A6J7MAD3_9ZZZZ
MGTSGFAAIPTAALDLPLVQRLLRSPRFRVRVPITNGATIAASPRGGADEKGQLVALEGQQVAPAALDEGEQPTRLTQERFGPIGILHAGWMHYHREQHADGVGQQVALPADDFLARVVAGRVERSAPFCAPFDVWPSMIAVVKLASRPACSRTDVERLVAASPD